MKSVLISIQAEHNANIEKGLKTEELRTRVPKCELPIKLYTYESGKNGRHKVTNEWICREIREYPNADSYPLSLIDRACVPFSYICDYAKDGEKFLCGLAITDLVIYDEPRELSEFKTFCKDFYDGKHCDECKYFIDGRGYEYDESDCGCNGLKPIERPPQSWCYVESEDTEEGK
jgi:hypothetical protein